MADDGLRASDISFAIGEKRILRGVSISAGAGETLAIVGPSGCGKSTLLRVIAGLERPQTGTVIFDDEDVSGTPAERRRFGMMFQDYALFPHLDVASNIGFGLRYTESDGAAKKRRVGELLELVSLTGMEKRRVDTLSGGERQRVALARALAPSPRLLMLDEPLGALDRTLRDRLLDELRDVLGRVGVTTLYVTHDQAEAFAIGDRMVMMRDGLAVREGTPAGIYLDPQTEFVATFFGLSNIVPADVSNGTARTACGTWVVPGAKSGAAGVLLREEGAKLVVASGTGVVSGKVIATTFLGRASRLSLDTAAGRLNFELAVSVDSLPAVGEMAHVSVPTVQVLAPEPDGAPTPLPC